MANALIIGLDGQDGAYLARHLARGGDRVRGTWLDEDAGRRHLAALGLDAADFRPERFVLPAAVEAWEDLLARAGPDEIYFLAGISSVGLSFARPEDTFATTADSVLRLLEVLRRNAASTRLVYAGSAECFGVQPAGTVCDEGTPFRPASSPYAAGKAAAAELIRVYRAGHGLHASVALLSNHESPLRPPAFVTRKIVDGALAMAAGKLDVLRLGNLAVARDWGWAEEFVAAYPLIARRGEAGDYIIATGRTTTLWDFLAAVFAQTGPADWRGRVESAAAHARPLDIPSLHLCPDKASRELGWRAATRGGEEVAVRMVEALR